MSSKILVLTPKLLPFFDCVDGVDDVLLSQTFNQFSVELPDFQEAALQTLVVQGVHLVPTLLNIFFFVADIEAK